MAECFETLVVQIFGGPGIGKTTTALGVTYQLKMHDILAEYVPEYAKQLVYEESWDLLDGSERSQAHIFEVQRRRIRRLLGKVQVAVTDSPVLLNVAYVDNPSASYEQTVLDEFGSTRNFNVLLMRSGKLKYQESGRIQTLDEAKQKDDDIVKVLDRYGVLYHIYPAGSVDVITADILRALSAI